MSFFASYRERVKQHTKSVFCLLQNFHFEKKPTHLENSKSFYSRRVYCYGHNRDWEKA